VTLTLPSQCVTRPPLNNIKTTSRELVVALAAEDTPGRSAYYGPFQDYHRRQRPGNHYAGLPARLVAETRQPLRRFPGAASDRRSATIRRPLGRAAAFLPTKPRLTTPAAEPTERPSRSRAPAVELHLAAQSSPVSRNYIERPRSHRFPGHNSAASLVSSAVRAIEN
jgi:hypothetical protein